MLVILDRDGVINVESREYIKTPEEWIEIPGSMEAIAKLKQAGHQVVVATNQSGLARGFFTQATLDLIHQKMKARLADFGAEFDGIFYCPHHPDDRCECRKPKPGLLLQIAKQFNTDLSKAIMVGDSLRDIQAGQAVNTRIALLRTGNGAETERASLDALAGAEIYSNLLELSMVLAGH